jgi:predicted thioesterase
MMIVEPGMVHTRRLRVEPWMSAERWRNPGVDVLATPTLVGLFEETAVLAIQPALGPGQASVGSSVNVRHLRATPVGEEVTVRAEVTGVDGRRITFELSAQDRHGLIGEGTHERVLIDLARFMAKVREQAGTGHASRS